MHVAFYPCFDRLLGSWIINKFLKKIVIETLKLMNQNGVYPHDYTDPFDKFNVKQLPTEDVFSMMKIYLMSNITNAQNVWNTFRW